MVRKDGSQSEESRELIKKALRENHGNPLSRAELATKLSFSKTTVHELITRLVEEGEVVQIEAGSGSTRRYQLAATARSRWIKGLNTRALEKREIAELVVALVLGGTPKTRTIAAVEKFRAALAADSAIASNPSLKHRLETFFHQRDKTIYIDGGSTGYYVAEKLRTAMIPSTVLGLWNLRIITNCPPIAEKLTDSMLGPSVVLIGGQISRDTHFVSGYLAETVVRQWDWSIDMAFVGTSGVDPTFGFFSHSEDEAAMKSLMFSRSRIRCAVMDSSKAQPAGSESGEMAFRFAPMGCESIELVLTDHHIDEHAVRHVEDLGTKVLAISQRHLPKSYRTIKSDPVKGESHQDSK